MPTKIKKRNGDVVDFAPDKIRVAIRKAFLATETPFTDTTLDYLTEQVVIDIDGDVAKIEDVQDLVEDTLMRTSYHRVARAYVRYRHIRELARKQNTTDESILSLLHNTNKELAEENSNKNTVIAATQRDYIAGEVSRDLTRRILLPKKISDAHDKGILHFHDADYFIQPIFNCFAPWTKFLTDEGETKFENHRDGDVVRVLCEDGEWRDATVRNYGPREMVNVVLEDASGTKPQAVSGATCTRDHRWILEDGTVTTNLRPGDVLRPASIDGAVTWRVRTISPYGGVGETIDAWCVEEPVTHSFTLSPGVLTGNCCLINIGDMLDNGTVMNRKLIESPHSFRVAATIVTQIIASVASNQYGGQSVDLRHLGKYLRMSREKFERKVADDCPHATPEEHEHLVASLLHDELAAGVQTIQYQINTLMTTNGQSPFVTLFLNLRAGDPYIKENAMIIEEVLRQRLLGIKNEKGVYITPAFPKLVYVLDEHNCLKGGEYDYLTDLAVECSAKRMYPDYISAKKMRENYQGNVFSPMGCVDGSSVITYRLNDEIHVESFALAWTRLSTIFEPQNQNPDDPTRAHLFMDTPGLEIYDLRRGFVKNLRVIRNMADNWVHISFDDGRATTVTADHPFETETRGVVAAADLDPSDRILALASDPVTMAINHDFGPAETRKIRPLRVVHVEDRVAASYDVTTESEHFTFNGIYSHNCRSFLAPWKDEDGNYKFEGRFNQGVVSLNLPQIGLIAAGDEDKFWALLDERLQLCFEALMCRHEALRKVTSDSSPIHWRYGAIARLPEGASIEPLLYGGYSSISLGYIGLYECTVAMKHVSHTTPEGRDFALRVMRRLRKACDDWKAETNIGFALYGTPAESLCYRFARIDRETFGDVPDVTDKGYYTNSYHVDVREPIDAFSKFLFENQFQPISSGGCISYAEIPNMRHNIEALKDVVRFIYDNIQYAEFNTKSDYCQACGFDGELQLDENNEWVCPQCGNRDRRLMNCVRRTCGYLGENFWNVGKTKEIRARVTHL